MDCTLVLKPRAIKDLQKIPRHEAARILDALEQLQVDFTGDIKKLTNFTPEFRLRIGTYRVLFEFETASQIVVYRIVHRREAYR